MSRAARINALFAILFSQPRYLQIVGPELAWHQTEFRSDVLDALGWTTLATLVAVASALSTGKLDFAAPLNVGKAVSGAGAVLGAWATWFALANPQDTWDREERLDTRLRGTMFKAAFFPGLILGLAGAM